MTNDGRAGTSTSRDMAKDGRGSTSTAHDVTKDGRVSTSTARDRTNGPQSGSRRPSLDGKSEEACPGARNAVARGTRRPSEHGFPLGVVRAPGTRALISSQSGQPGPGRLGPQGKPRAAGGAGPAATPLPAPGPATQRPGPPGETARSGGRGSRRYAAPGAGPCQRPARWLLGRPRPQRRPSKGEFPMKFRRAPLGARAS